MQHVGVITKLLASGQHKQQINFNHWLPNMSCITRLHQIKHALIYFIIWNDLLRCDVKQKLTTFWYLPWDSWLRGCCVLEHSATTHHLLGEKLIQFWNDFDQVWGSGSRYHQMKVRPRKLAIHKQESWPMTEWWQWIYVSIQLPLLLFSSLYFNALEQMVTDKGQNIR